MSEEIELQRRVSRPRRAVSVSSTEGNLISRTVSGDASRQFEKQRAEQVRIWSEERPFFAAKTGLLKVLKKYEADSFTTFDERLAYYMKQCDPAGASVLHVAILCDSADVAKYLIKTYGKDLVCRTYHTGDAVSTPYEGETALHLAIVKNQFDIVKLLVQYGADVNARATGKFFDKEEDLDRGIYMGSTPLHFAVAVGNLKMAEYLLNHNADASITDQYKNSALHIAVHYADKEMYDLVASRDQAFEGKLRVARNEDDLTPLRLAASLANREMFEHILDKTRELSWSFGPVEGYLYPLEELDTTEPNGVLEILVQHGTLQHAKLFEVSPLRELLEEKWQKFGRAGFTFFLFAYLLFIGCLLAGMWLTNGHPNDYSRRNDTARLVLEIVGCLGVIVNLIVFEIPQLYHFLRNPLQSSGYHAGSVVFFISGWMMRITLIVLIVLRLVKADETVQLAFMSFMAVLAPLNFLNFARYSHRFTKFVLMTEKMALDMRFWTMVFLIELFAFSFGFQILYQPNKEEIEQNSDSRIDLEFVPLAMFTLIKWTMGEFNFSSAEVEFSVSIAATYILFICFVALSSTILFNILIALMTSTFQTYSDQADSLSVLQWATQIISTEFKLRRLKLPFFEYRAGTLGEFCGGRPGQYYKSTLVRHTEDRTRGDETSNAYAVAGIKHVPGYPSSYYEANLSIWDDIMGTVSSDSSNGNYIEDFAELVSILELYDAYQCRSVNRETAAFILQDLVFNNCLNPTTELRNAVLQASQVVASKLDPDGDDEIPYETLMTFCRLSRMSLFQRKANDEVPRFALIIVDMQNDFASHGTVPVNGWRERNMVLAVNKLREAIPWDVVVRTQDWHPEGHVSFLSDCDPSELYGESAEVIEKLRDDGQVVIFPDDVDDMVWPSHCVQNTSGAEFVSGLKTSSTDIIIKKGQDAYVDSFSAFWNNERKKETSLYEHLFNERIEYVFVCGIGYDCAVGRTAHDAACYGFETFVVEDASCWFDDRWQGEMQLELASVSVSDVSTSQVQQIRNAHVQSGMSLQSIRNIAKNAKKNVSRKPTHMFVGKNPLQQSSHA